MFVIIEFEQPYCQFGWPDQRLQNKELMKKADNLFFC